MKPSLPDIRNALLALHKTLVDSERVSYEKTVGTITSPNHFLQLLTSDPWFAWLHPLSQLIVAMDEFIDAKEPPAPGAADALMRQAGRLVEPSEAGQDFARHYFEALQRDPDVVLAHAGVVRVLGRRKP